MVTVRSFQRNDVGAYVRLVNEADESDQLGRATTIPLVQERVEHPRFLPEQDLYFATQSGCLVGCVETWCELEIGRVVVDGVVRPAYRCQGVGTALLEVAVERARGLGADEVHVAVDERAGDAQSFLRARGFALVRCHWRMALVGCISDRLPRTEGLEIRRFVRGDEEDLCALQNRAFAGQWGFCPNRVEEIRYLVNTSLCRAEGIVFVCEGRKKVAYCWASDDGVNRRKAYIRMLGVDPAYRNRGLGRLALITGIRYVKERGMDEIALQVDSANPAALQLYRSLGFEKSGVILWYGKMLRLE